MVLTLQLREEQTSTCSQLAVTSALRDCVTFNHTISILALCILVPISLMQGWDTESSKSFITGVVFNRVTSSIMKDSMLGTQIKWSHVLVAGFYGVKLKDSLDIHK